MQSLFRFPHVVNETAARMVAGFVVALTMLYLLTGSTVLLAFIAYGFVARVVAGPSLSPIAQLVTRVIVPRLAMPERPTAGPPKRFAQAIGATLSLSALILAVTGSTNSATLLVGMISVAATLESALGFCLGCVIFARLIAFGVIPEAVCEACGDLSKRQKAMTTMPGG